MAIFKDAQSRKYSRTCKGKYHNFSTPNWVELKYLGNFQYLQEEYAAVRKANENSHSVNSWMGSI